MTAAPPFDKPLEQWFPIFRDGGEFRFAELMQVLQNKMIYGHDEATQALLETLPFEVYDRELNKEHEKRIADSHTLKMMEPQDIEAIEKKLKEFGIDRVSFYHCGQFGVVLRAGDDLVVRISLPHKGIKGIPPGRTMKDIPQILQPLKRERASIFMVELLPFLPEAEITPDHKRQLQYAIAQDHNGYIWDLKEGNIRLMKDGTPVIIDADAVIEPATAQIQYAVNQDRQEALAKRVHYTWTNEQGIPKQTEFYGDLLERRAVSQRLKPTTMEPRQHKVRGYEGAANARNLKNYFKQVGAAQVAGEEGQSLT